jgi:hypothetical protein
MGRFGPSWDAPAWDKTSPKTWDEWTDVLGHTYRSGDYVAVSVINGKSPQMVIGKVIQINRVDSKGMLLMDSEREWVPCEEADEGARLHPHPKHPNASWKRLKTTWIDSCTVKVMPLLDARGFSRGWSGAPPKAVTYRLWENIIKVDARLYELKVEADMAAATAELADLSVELTK